MKVILFFFAALNIYSQEYKYLKTVEGIDISSRISNDLLYIRWVNNNHEKVEISFDFLVWMTDSGAFVEKMNGGGFSAKAGETISGNYSGSFWTIPKSYDIKNLRFKLEGLKVKFPERERPIANTFQGKTATTTHTSYINNIDGQKQLKSELKKPDAVSMPIDQQNQTIVNKRQSDNAYRSLQNTQDYLNASNNRLNENMQIIAAAGADLRNELNKIYEEKKEKERIAHELRYTKEEEKRQQRIIEANYEAERLKEEEEENRRRETAALNEMYRQWEYDIKIFGSYMVSKKPSEFESKIDKVFYITYERNYITGKVRVKTYILKKYSDDSWMLLNDMIAKIGFKSYLTKEGVSHILGAYDSKHIAMEAIDRIRQNIPDATINSDFIVINDDAPAGTDSDFWKD